LEIPDTELRLLIVDDASTDGTAQLADELALRVPGRVEVLHRPAKQGLGNAYIAGFSTPSVLAADLVAQLDSDESHDPAVLLTMVEAIRGADLVIGSRYMTGGGIDSDWAYHRLLLSWLANRVVIPTVLSLPLTDATSGYRLWRRDTLARIAPSANIRSSGYGFQVEMAYLTHNIGCHIREVPIFFRERQSGRSKMSLPVKLNAIRDILSVRFRHGPTKPTR
jgi:dolichol-phosphate mannosyltransferase